MAEVMKFNGQLVGDEFLRVEPATHALTPPTRRIGFLQDSGAVDSSSRNTLHARVFYVTVIRESNIATDEVISAIQQLVGRVGDITVTGGAADMRCDNWTIDEVQKPSLPSGFGGRFCAELAITAVGTREPIY